MDTELLPVNLRLLTLQCGVLRDYFSYQTYLLITRQGCSLLETVLTAQGWSCAATVGMGLDYLDGLFLIIRSSLRSLAWIKRHSCHACPCRKDRPHTRDCSLNPCCSCCRVELLTRTRITASTKEGSYEQPELNLRNVLMCSFAEWKLKWNFNHIFQEVETDRKQIFGSVKMLSKCKIQYWTHLSL